MKLKGLVDMLTGTLRAAARAGGAAQAFLQEELAEERRTVAPFDRIVLDFPGNLVVQCGSGGPLTVRAAEPLLPKVETEVREGVLTLRLAATGVVFRRIEVVVPVERLASLEVRGAGDAVVHGIEQFELSVEARGTGDIELHGTATQLYALSDGPGGIDASCLTAGNAELEALGAGDIRLELSSKLIERRESKVKARVKSTGDIILSGTVGEIVLYCNGTGNVEAADLTAASAEITATSTGDVDLTLGGRYDGPGDLVTARISGTGNLVLAGDVREARLTAASTGDIQAADLTAEKAKLNCQGTGDIEATVTRRVEAVVTSCGDITIYGEPPERYTRTSGVGDIDFQ